MDSAPPLLPSPRPAMAQCSLQTASIVSIPHTKSLEHSEPSAEWQKAAGHGTRRISRIQAQPEALGKPPRQRPETRTAALWLSAIIWAEHRLLVLRCWQEPATERSKHATRRGPPRHAHSRAAGTLCSKRLSFQTPQMSCLQLMPVSLGTQSVCSHGRSAGGPSRGQLRHSLAVV